MMTQDGGSNRRMEAGKNCIMNSFMNSNLHQILLAQLHQGITTDKMCMTHATHTHLQCRDTDTPGSSSPWRLHVERWRLIFVGPHYGTCFMSPLYHLDFWKICAFLTQYIHTHTHTHIYIYIYIYINRKT
jgi:hypothetical protein